MDPTALDSDVIFASPAGFATIFDRHFDAVHAYLQRRIGPDVADELTSQTFLVAFDGRAHYDPAQPDARPWLFGIATNLLRRHHRAEQRQLRAYARSAIDPVLDAFDGIEDRLDASEMRCRLLDALADISPEELDALLLYAWADLSYREIATALEIPTGTVRSRLSRARGRLRVALDLDRRAASNQPVAGEEGSP